MAHTEDAHFEGKTIDMLFTGDIDLAEKLIDMKIRATTIDLGGLVLPKVPLLGEVLEKARKSVFSINFYVDGPLADPELHLHPWHKHKPNEKQ
jgi:hypothetical protein